MHFHLAELKAFFISRVAIKQYCFDPLVYLFPEIASLALFTTGSVHLLIASKVERDLLKPYWSIASKGSTTFSILLWMIRSKILPAVPSMHSGR